MGAPVGNTNSSSDNRLWANTIRRAIAQGDPERLRKIAEKLLDLAAEGDLQAMKELGDRVDGKPSQTVAVGGTNGDAIQHAVSVSFVGSASEGV